MGWEKNPLGVEKEPGRGFLVTWGRFEKPGPTPFVVFCRGRGKGGFFRGKGGTTIQEKGGEEHLFEAGEEQQKKQKGKGSGVKKEVGYKMAQAKEDGNGV